MMIDGIRVTMEEGVTEAEVLAAVEEEKAIWASKGKTLGEVNIAIEGEELVIKSLERSPIKRIRRITGYLSTQERFNDAKQSELADRVVHQYQ